MSCTPCVPLPGGVATTSFPPRCVPWVHAKAADVNSLCATDLHAGNLSMVTASVTSLTSDQTTVAAQLTAASLTTTGLTATALSADTLTSTGTVAISDTVLVNANYVGPQLFTVTSTATFVIPTTAASSCTVYFPATLGAGADCTLPSSPPAGLIIYVCNASATNSVTVSAPTGILIVPVTTPTLPAATYVLASGTQARFLWAATQWVESAP